MDALVQWFTETLSGVMSSEIVIFIISMIPILIIYAIFQKPLQNGLSSADGVKG